MTSESDKLSSLIDKMKKSRGRSPGLPVKEKGKVKKGGLPGFSRLRKKKGKKKRKHKEGPSIPLELQVEVIAAQKALDDLVRMAKIDSAGFQKEFKPKTPAEKLYKSEYNRMSEEIIWYFRRMSSGLDKYDVRTLERCFASYQDCKKKQGYLDFLLLEKSENYAGLKRLKEAVIEFINTGKGEDEIIRSCAGIKEYAEELSRMNQVEFDKIPDDEKVEFVVDAYNRLERNIGEMKRGVKSIGIFLRDSTHKDLTKGLLQLKAAYEDLDEMIGVG